METTFEMWFFIQNLMDSMNLKYGGLEQNLPRGKRIIEYNQKKNLNNKGTFSEGTDTLYHSRFLMEK